MKPNCIVLIFLLLILCLNSIDVQAYTQGPAISTKHTNYFLSKVKGRSLLSHDNIDSKHDKTLVTWQDGTIMLLDDSSGETLWKIPTGVPISSVVLNGKEVTSSSNEEVETHLDDKVIVDIGGKTNLAKIIGYDTKDAPKNTMFLRKQNDTLFIVDSGSGKIIDIINSSTGKDASSETNANDLVDGSPGNSENVTQKKSNSENVRELHITRADYELLCYSFETKKILWSIKFSNFEAFFKGQEKDTNVNCVHFRIGTDVRFILDKMGVTPNDANQHRAHELMESSTSPVEVGNTDANTYTTPESAQDKIHKISNKSKIFHYSKSQYVTILCFFLSAILLCICISTIIRQKLQEPKSSSGKMSTASKRKKSRKSANCKNGANTKIIDENILYDVEKFGGISAERNAKEPGSHHEIPVEADGNGRRIGKLLISNTEIAKGSNGTVVLEGIYDGRPVAVKRLVQAHHDVAYKEIRNLIASDRHPNIVRWYGVEYDSDFVYLSLERCACSLSDLIRICSDSPSNSLSTQGKRMSSGKEYNVRLEVAKGINKHIKLWRENGYPSPLLLRLMRDVVSGLVHLHELGIIHRDLKPQNILIIDEKSLSAKLSDMGISKRLVEEKSSLGHHPTGGGSSGWQAPEQLLHGRQTRAVDLFGLGCVLYYCITGGKHPFGEPMERDINIVKNHVDLSTVDHIPEAMDLLSHLLDPNPQLRLTAVHVLNHPVFWSSEKRLSFLRDVSDRIELEDRGINSHLLKTLENIGPVALGGNWDGKMETIFIDNIGRYRRYKYDSTRDLLRVMRNKLNHYRELPKDIQELLGPVPDGFDAYFSNRFPKFFIEVYKVISRMCKEEECFKKYFEEL